MKNANAGNVWVMRAPVLSTVHLKPETVAMFSAVAEPGYEPRTGVLTVPMDNGFIVYHEPNIEFVHGDGKIPPDLRRAMIWSIGALNTEYTRFDGDGDTVVGLRKYKKAWAAAERSACKGAPTT